MKVSTHVILQVLGLIISVGTVVQNGAFVPTKYIPFVVLIVSAAQGLLAWFNHYYTPDGTKIA